jgi:Protein of unknown function (DUF4232)
MLRNRMTVIGGIALALLVAGCDSADNNAGDPSVPTVDGVAASSTAVQPPSTSPEPTPPSPSATTRPAPAASSAPAPAADPNECKVAELKLSLAGGDAAAGTYYRQLRFTNTGGRTCVIQGFPGVSYVAGDDGHQVGPAAYREGRKGPAISLKPGMTVYAPLGFVQVANYDPAVCRPTEVRGLRVYPPHEYDSMFLAAPGTGCAGNPPGHQLVVRTVQ